MRNKSDYVRKPIMQDPESDNVNVTTVYCTGCGKSIRTVCKRCLLPICNDCHLMI